MFNICYKKTDRCRGATPVSDNLWIYPAMAGAISAYKHVPAPRFSWQVLNDVHCPGYDLHRSSSMQPTATIEACFEQCYGLNNEKKFIFQVLH